MGLTAATKPTIEPIDLLASLAELLGSDAAAKKRIAEYRDAAAAAVRERAKAKADRANADSEIADAWLAHEQKVENERTAFEERCALHDREMTVRTRNVEGREQHAAEIESKANKFLEEATAMRADLKRKLEQINRVAAA